VARPVSDPVGRHVPIPTPGQEPGRLRIDEVGRCLVVSAGRISRRGAWAARMLPAEESRVTVIAPDAVATRMPELAERLWRWVPGASESVRLVMAGAAATDGEHPSPAQQLSELLGVEVIAPDGRPLAVPGGSLFVTGTGRDGGAWVRLRPGRPARRDGRRYPAPEWEPDLAGFVDPGIAGVDVEEVPAGLWVRWAGTAGASDLGFAVPVHRATMALLVSRAGDPPLRNADLRRVAQALPVALWDRLAVVPYGDEPVAGARLGAVVSVAANRVVPVRTGLPLCRQGGGIQVVAVGPDGEPAWSPFAHTLAWPPHGGSRLLGWTPPASRLLPVGPGQLQLNERWLVEVIEAGLWLREVDRCDGAAVVRRLPLRSRYCTVVVGGLGAGPRPPWRAVVRLVRQLPGTARARLRLAVPDVAGERVVRAATKVCRRNLRDRPVYLLTADGQLVRYPLGSPQPPRPAELETLPPELPLSRPIGLPVGHRDGADPPPTAAPAPPAPARPPIPPAQPPVPVTGRPPHPAPASSPALPPTVPVPDGAPVSRRTESVDP
jgi:hypothetical protein